MFSERGIMKAGSHFLSIGLLPALIFGSVIVHVGQVTAEQFRKHLTDRAGFERADVTAMDAGETVVKLLPVDDKRRIATLGIVRLQNSHSVSMAGFRDSLSHKDNNSKLSSGEFAIPASIGDLDALDLREKDVNDLKKCEVGKCDVKLPAALIKRFRSDVDWNSPEHGAMAAQLYKQILVDYINEYLSRGDAALMQYDSRKVSVSLRDEYRHALEKSLFVGDIAPEFVGYLRDYPRTNLPGTENTITWSNITFGLEPVIAVTHSTYYSSQNAGNSVLLVAAKQIYSSRYLDSSLAFTMLVNFRVNGGTDSYLIFTDASRSNVLGGPLSGLSRGPVVNEAKERVREMLSRAKVRLSAEMTGTPALSPDVEEMGTLEWLWNLGKLRLVRIFLLFTLGIIAFLLYRDWKRSSGGSA